MDFALDLILKTTLLLAVTGLAAAALTKSSAASRHLVLTLGLAGSLLLPALALVLPRWDVPLLDRPGTLLPVSEASARDRTVAVVRVAPERGATVVPLSSKENTGPAAGREPAARLGHLGVDLPVEMSSTPGHTLLPSWPVLLGALWAGGSAAALLRLLAGLRRVKRLARSAAPAGEEWASLVSRLAASLGVKQRIRVLCGDGVSVPMTSGFLKPIVLLPEDARTWPPGRRRVVLLHEIAHVSRLDGLSLLVVELAKAAYWFHPLVHILAVRSRRDCEKAADDLVLSADTRPSDYAGELLAMVRSLRSGQARPLPAVAMAQPAEFEGRVRAILSPGLPRSAPARWSSRAAAGASLSLVGALAAFSPWAPPRIDAAAMSDVPAPAFLLPPGTAERTVNRADVIPAVRTITKKAVRHAEVVELTLVSKRQPTTAKGWFERAHDLHNDERWAEAAEAFQKAYEGGYREGTSAYNAACGFARLNDRDRAFEWLQKAADAGFDVASYLGRDDDLDNLRSDPRFRELKKTVRRGEGERAAARYERLAAKPTTDGSAWFQVGRELHNNGRYDLAEKAYRSAAARGYREATSLYNAACAASMREDKAAALALLKASLDAGFDSPDHMAKDDDLDNIRAEAGYRDLQDLADELTLSDLSNFGPLNRAFRMTRRSGAREAAKRFDAYTKKHPDSGRAYFNLGFAQLAGDRPEAAVPAFQRAFELGYRKPVTMYNLACSYARLDEKDKAFDWLFKSLEAGFGDRGQLRSDEDLDNLRGDPRFSKALRLASAKDHDDD
jgi:Flp pilus assembly protein TadD